MPEVFYKLWDMILTTAKALQKKNATNFKIADWKKVGLLIATGDWSYHCPWIVGPRR